MCDLTIAEAVGKGYDDYEMAYIIIVVLLNLITLPMAVLVFYKNGFAPVNMQKRVMFLTCVISLSMLIRCPDPQGFRRRYPIVFVGAVTDMAAASCYSLAILQSFDWVRIIMKVCAEHL
jgi:hypothetical protein